MDRVNQQNYKTSTMLDRSERTRWVEILLASFVVIWRMAAGTPTALWKDWMLVAALFWFYAIFKSESPAWPVVVVTTMAYLLGIYLLGQIPHALAVLGLGL